MKAYGQRDVPEIILRIKSNKYNISEYWQKYSAKHSTRSNSTWTIKISILPEELKEELYLGVTEVLITERHRNLDGEDVKCKYLVVEPHVDITESASCDNDNPISYTIAISGIARKLFSKKEKNEL